MRKGKWYKSLNWGKHKNKYKYWFILLNKLIIYKIKQSDSSKSTNTHAITKNH